MKQKITSYVFKAAAIITLVLILAIPITPRGQILEAGAIAPGAIFPKLLTPNFGGKIDIALPEVCLILISVFPPIIIPYPFLYLEVGDPSPADLYYFPFLPGFLQLSTLYEYKTLIPTAWALGNYWPKADDAFRMLCINGFLLPDADGIIRKVGTSLPTGSLDVLNAGKLNGADGTQNALPLFDPKKFPQFCDPASPEGKCIPNIQPGPSP